MAKPELKTFTGKVVEDAPAKGHNPEFVKGRILVEKDKAVVAVVVPVNEKAPEPGETVTVAYEEEPIFGGTKISFAKLVKPAPVKK